MVNIQQPFTENLSERFDAKFGYSITAVFVFYIGLAIWLVTPAPPVGIYWDDAWYLFMAEWISGDSTYQALSWSMLQLRQYPPLYSVLIHWAGAGLEDPGPAFFVNAFLYAISAALVVVWFWKEGMPLMLGVLSSGLFLLNPVTLYWLPTLFSEHLYICLSLAALITAAVSGDRQYFWLLSGLMTGMAISTRSVGWALSIGMTVYLLSNLKLKQIPLYLIGVGIGLIPFFFYRAGLPEVTSYLSQPNLFSDWMSVDFMISQFKGLSGGWIHLWGSKTGALLAAGVIAPGIAVRLFERKLDAFYGLFYLGLLWLWPYPDHMSRFLWPIMPVLLLAGFSFLRKVNRFGRFHEVNFAIFFVIFILMMPSGIGRTVARLSEPLPDHLQNFSRMPEWSRSDSPKMGMTNLETRFRLLVDMREITSRVPANDCIYSELPALIAANSKRVSFASPWPTLNDSQHTTYQCRYYYLIPAGLPDTDSKALSKFSLSHSEIYRSMAPFEQNEPLPLGVLFRLNVQ